MSENYSLKEMNEWADKVIDCISKWADEMNKAFNGTPTSIKIEKLDFTEHDKVFEDEVADLKQRIRELIKEKDEYKRKCNAFGFENQDLKKITKGYEDKIAKREEAIGYYKDSFYRAEKNCNKLYRENKELKQRIAELESKETEKPTKINLNDRIKVKLTPIGAEIYYHQYDDVNKKIKKNGGTELEPMMPQIDKDGYTEFQLWHFMELYGEHIGMCKPNVISPLDIIIVE